MTGRNWPTSWIRTARLHLFRTRITGAVVFLSGMFLWTTYPAFAVTVTDTTGPPIPHLKERVNSLYPRRMAVIS